MRLKWGISFILLLLRLCLIWFSGRISTVGENWGWLLVGFWLWRFAWEVTFSSAISNTSKVSSLALITTELIAMCCIRQRSSILSVPNYSPSPTISLASVKTKVYLTFLHQTMITVPLGKRNTGCISLFLCWFLSALSSTTSLFLISSDGWATLKSINF